MSLWSVDDQATEALMTAFYGHWHAGEGKAQPLQAAQAEVRKNPQWASPFYSAGFVLNGDSGVSENAPTPEAAVQAASPTAPSCRAAQAAAAPAVGPPLAEVRSTE